MMNIRHLKLAFAILLLFPISPLFAGAVDHTTLDRLLLEAVDKHGGVDYEVLLAKKPQLDDYLAGLAKIDPNRLDSREEQLAYWINLYNSLTIQSVLDHWPVRSVLNDFPGNAFFEKWKHKTAVGELTLNQIETDIIRKRFQEPRVHFALNCASKGCPDLFPGAYTAENLEKVLEMATKRFINDPAKNRIDASQGVAHLSPIFDWYGADFDAAGGSLTFVAKYLDNAEAWKIGKYKVVYNDYDWGLNSR
ncbi:MAG: DUF547 domain-containing protein [Candidatus Omnitrophica bacterium]|nr:DUF547 domain-containing protein [Candidatus Omnitrophota bacterium]